MLFIKRFHRTYNRRRGRIHSLVDFIFLVELGPFDAHRVRHFGGLLHQLQMLLVPLTRNNVAVGDTSRHFALHAAAAQYWREHIAGRVKRTNRSQIQHVIQVHFCGCRFRERSLKRAHRQRQNIVAVHEINKDLRRVRNESLHRLLPLVAVVVVLLLLFRQFLIIVVIAAAATACISDAVILCCSSLLRRSVRHIFRFAATARRFDGDESRQTQLLLAEHFGDNLEQFGQRLVLQEDKKRFELDP
mmetsp:Transcript_45658/g.75920  ORF Transcript_45658/g.75920 Transcript_45658/m.75920 type:complete len:245 (+) Transcript_45658:515-1249(+)